jgi:hypothetical protein
MMNAYLYAGKSKSFKVFFFIIINEVSTKALFILLNKVILNLTDLKKN